MTRIGAADGRPILILAPFSPEGSGTLQHLGAANKLRSVFRILSKSGRPVILVNSAHNAERLQGGRRGRIQVGDLGIEVVYPFTFPFRPLGKLANLLAYKYYSRLLKRENPALVWIYNGYAFDAAVGLDVAAHGDCSVVVQIEDWPTARPRGLNPKPFIDLWFLRRAVKRADLVTCVNEPVAARVEQGDRKYRLLPGTIPEQLTATGSRRSPFASDNCTIGYFGGLTEEKGADIILSLSSELPEHWDLVVCGSGALREQFAAAANKNPRIKFFENLPQERLYELVLDCDVIVNPHRPLDAMNEGVFPFKVFEALAAGKVLISTPLPKCGVDLGSVIWFDGSIEGLRAALSDAKDHFARSSAHMNKVRDDVAGRFSENAIYADLLATLPVLAATDSAIGP